MLEKILVRSKERKREETGTMDDKEMFHIILRKSYLLGQREKDRWRRLRIKLGKEDSITERETKEKERDT